MRATFKKIAERATYKGVIKDTSNKIVWSCTHRHFNRDNDGWINPRQPQRIRVAACTCAAIALAEMQRNETPKGCKGLQDLED